MRKTWTWTERRPQEVSIQAWLPPTSWCRHQVSGVGYFPAAERRKLPRWATQGFARPPLSRAQRTEISRRPRSHLRQPGPKQQRPTQGLSTRTTPDFRLTSFWVLKRNHFHFSRGRISSLHFFQYKHLWISFDFFIFPFFSFLWEKVFLRIKLNKKRKKKYTIG